MQRKRNLYATGTYMIWGLFPIYWSQLETIPALQLIGHCIAWSFVLLLLFLVAARQLPALGASLNRRTILIYLGVARLLRTYWFTCVWGVIHSFVVEASLGYFVYPLFSVFLGMIFFGERLRRTQWVSIGLAAFGVLYLTLTHGSLPWIALVLAATSGWFCSGWKAFMPDGWGEVPLCPNSTNASGGSYETPLHRRDRPDKFGMFGACACARQ